MSRQGEHFLIPSNLFSFQFDIVFIPQARYRKFYVTLVSSNTHINLHKD